MIDCLMNHIAFIIRSMPTRHPKRAADKFLQVDLLRLTTFVTYPPTICHDSQYLSSLMVLPLCPSASAEVEVSDAYAVWGEGWVDLNLSGECAEIAGWE